ncbi:hypothetical protein [Streptomyces huiliensis]|uniref:hypothetical protein n=1 Tax=Streptomyces huiliensis TaxID=2876027 RepID=UPI001CBABA31|nr:hypothetical protein [Streptomyces huiliensis]MBZ4319522.1 hypothetical protein [Streptomyces huiliensis]
MARFNSKLIGTVLTSAALVVGLAGSASADSTDVENYYGVAEIHGSNGRLGCYDKRAEGWGFNAEIEVWHEGTRGWMTSGVKCYDDTSRSTDDSGWTWVGGDFRKGTNARIHVWGSRGSSTEGHAYSRTVTMG